MNEDQAPGLYDITRKVEMVSGINIILVIYLFMIKDIS